MNFRKELLSFGTVKDYIRQRDTYDQELTGEDIRNLQIQTIVGMCWGKRYIMFSEIADSVLILSDEERIGLSIEDVDKLVIQQLLNLEISEIDYHIDELGRKIIILDAPVRDVYVISQAQNMKMIECNRNIVRIEDIENTLQEFLRKVKNIKDGINGTKVNNSTSSGLKRRLES